MLRTTIPNTFELLRPLFKGPFAAGGGFDRESGNALLASGGADYIVFGKLFTSNPDLPQRFAKGARADAVRRRDVLLPRREGLHRLRSRR